MEDALVARAVAITDYADTSLFIPDRDEDGREAPPEWFGMNPDYDEDSMEVIGSSVEEEGEAEDGGEMEAPEGGVGDQPQLDRASSNEPRPTEPAAAGDDQAKTVQPAAPAPDTAVSSDPPNPSAAPALIHLPQTHLSFLLAPSPASMLPISPIPSPPSPLCHEPAPTPVPVRRTAPVCHAP